MLTNAGGGHPGSLVVTLFYVGIGVAVQFCIGLGLALLCAQNLPGRKFFRVVFFLPMMITPVGIAYTFRMLTDTTKGPFTPIWQYFGWTETSWLADPWGARLAVMVGDAWQWIPFMFVVLLVAIESQPHDQREAALVDGASRWQVFRYVTWPAILPVSVTVVLIRVIEAFKIIHLPNVLTNGGPGIASESMTLHAYVAWRALDLGGSAAVSYMLLFVVAFACLSMLAFLRPAERGAAMSGPARRPGLRWLVRPRSPLEPSPLGMALSYAILGFWALVVLFPLYWVFITSFKQPIDVADGPFYLMWVDFQPSLHAWKYIFVDLGDDTFRPYLNTVIVSLISSALALVLGSMAGYGLARIQVSAAPRQPPCCSPDAWRSPRRLPSAWAWPGRSRSRLRSRCSCCWRRRSGGASSARSAMRTSRSG